MSEDDRPRPPAALEPSLRASLVELAKRDPEALPAVAAYAEDLAAWIESERPESGGDEENGDPDSRTTKTSGGDSDSGSDNGSYPPGVPEHATVTVTEIAGTKYRYYQWREGDEIRSETVELSADDETDRSSK